MTIIKGDVIAENFSSITVSQSILLFASYKNQIHHKRENPLFYSSAAGSVVNKSISSNHRKLSPSSGIPGSSPPFSKHNKISGYNYNQHYYQSVDAPFESSLPEDLINEYYPMNQIRKTTESTIQSKRFIPENIIIEVRRNVNPNCNTIVLLDNNVTYYYH